MACLMSTRQGIRVVSLAGAGWGCTTHFGMAPNGEFLKIHKNRHQRHQRHLTTQFSEVGLLFRIPVVPSFYVARRRRHVEANAH